MEPFEWKSKDGLSYYEYNKIEIKFCKECGLVKRLPYKYFNCPECDMPHMRMFHNIGHLVKNIDMYGLQNKRIVDEDIWDEVFKAFH